MVARMALAIIAGCGLLVSRMAATALTWVVRVRKAIPHAAAESVEPSAFRVIGATLLLKLMARSRMVC
jgi:hypothetical protein